MKWKKILTRNATILDRSLLIEGIGEGCYVLPQWKGFQNQYWSWEKGETYIHYLTTELKQFSEILQAAAKKDKKFADHYQQSSKKICEQAVQLTQAAAKKVSKNCTNQELNHLFQEFCHAFRSLGHTIIMPQEENQEAVLQRLKSCKIQKSAEDVLSILAAPAETSIETEEELGRLKIIEEIEQNKQYKQLFLKQKEEILQELEKKEYSGLLKKVKKHVNKYCWIPISFQKEAWDLEFYVGLLQSYIKENYNWKKRREEIHNLQKEKKEQKKQLEKEIDEDTSRLIAILRAGAYIRLYRANIFSLVLYSAFPILEEIGKQVGRERKELQWLTAKEINDALLNNQQLKKETTTRKECFVIFIEQKQYKQYEGKKAQEIIEKESPKEEVKKGNEIKGMCAYPGKVQGVVRIIFDAREMRRMNKGDILVCKETNPDLVLLMERAGAIVTDEGGVTSHAAVVSREMKKPCVIGTKIATKVLKDGDIVEVDAENGMVKKIK